MPTQTPAQEFQSEINSLKSKVKTLQDGVNLRSVRDTLEDNQTTVNSMGERIKEIRQNGYVFEKNLESQASDLVAQLHLILPNIRKQIDIQSTSLSTMLRSIESRLPSLSSSASNQPLTQKNLKSMKSSVSTLESKISSVEGTISGMYDKLRASIHKIDQHLDEIEWMLKQISEAPFSLLPTESGIMAVKSEWFKSGKEEKTDPEGILYLTDQRLLFEQKEEIATKKILFIATEKKKIQELLLEIPVELIKEVHTSKQGVFKNEDHLDITLETGAQVHTAHFHIWQDCSLWQTYINNARTKEFDKDRVSEIDEEILKKTRSAPTECPNCGGKLDQVILRGMDSITCKYCGVITRL
ncbi:hypothetical protein ACFLXB_07690 [Chloroflexota bacterium]